MICKNHEGQPSFFHDAVGKMPKRKQQRTNFLGGKAYLPKKCAVFPFETLCNSRNNQMLSQPESRIESQCGKLLE